MCNANVRLESDEDVEDADLLVGGLTDLTSWFLACITALLWSTSDDPNNGVFLTVQPRLS